MCGSTCLYLFLKKKKFMLCFTANASFGSKLSFAVCKPIDDSMAIMMAFQTPEVEVVGMTTIFGNVSTEDATRNALLLVCV